MPNLKLARDSIFFSSDERWFGRWQVGLRRAFLHHPAAWLLLCVPTDKGLNPASSQPPPQFGDVLGIRAQRWPTCRAGGHVLEGGTLSLLQLEQGEPRAAQTPRQHARATAKRRDSSCSPQLPGTAVARHIHTFLLELVPFFLPRRAARRVTSELAADVWSHRYHQLLVTTQMVHGSKTGLVLLLEGVFLKQVEINGDNKTAITALQHFWASPTAGPLLSSIISDVPFHLLKQMR